MNAQACSIKAAVREYWKDRVSDWKVASSLQTGSNEYFLEVERYRFEKLAYLKRVVDYQGWAGRSVLDVGCGLGTDLSRFARGGANVTGIDLAPRAVDLARQNFEQRGLEGKFSVMDGENLDFPDDSFDFVYCHTVLHFTPNPEAMIAEIHRVLRPGGHALLMTINRRSWLYRLHKSFGIKLDYRDAPVFRHFDPAEFTELTSAFDQRQMLVERFPIRTEVHDGWKAKLYNSLFVDLYNAMPERLIGQSGYHLLALVGERWNPTKP